MGLGEPQQAEFFGFSGYGKFEKRASVLTLALLAVYRLPFSGNRYLRKNSGAKEHETCC
jgi:hypothetical protein